MGMGDLRSACESCAGVRDSTPALPASHGAETAEDGRILLAEFGIPALHFFASPTWKALITMSLGWLPTGISVTSARSALSLELSRVFTVRTTATSDRKSTRLN